MTINHWNSWAQNVDTSPTMFISSCVLHRFDVPLFGVVVHTACSSRNMMYPCVPTVWRWFERWFVPTFNWFVSTLSYFVGFVLPMLRMVKFHWPTNQSRQETAHQKRMSDVSNIYVKKKKKKHSTWNCAKYQQIHTNSFWIFLENVCAFFTTTTLTNMETGVPLTRKHQGSHLDLDRRQVPLHIPWGIGRVKDPIADVSCLKNLWILKYLWHVPDAKFPIQKNHWIVAGQLSHLNNITHDLFMILHDNSMWHKRCWPGFSSFQSFYQSQATIGARNRLRSKPRFERVLMVSTGFNWFRVLV